MIWSTTTDTPETVYFAVVVTVNDAGRDIEHYSRPYMTRTTARMRATTLMRQNADVMDWWVVSYNLNHREIDRGDT